MSAPTTRHAPTFIENLPVRVKAFAASSVLLICMISLGGIAYVTLDRSQNGLHVLSSTILPKQRAFAMVQDAIVAAQMKTFRYVSWASNSVSPNLLRSLSAQVDQDLRAINTDIEKLASREDLSDTQKSSLKNLVEKWKSYESSAKDTIEVGATDAPMATMMLGQADERFLALAGDFQKLSDSAVARTDAISTELYADAGQKKLILGIGAALGLLLSIVISALVSRSIVMPIRSVTEAMQQLSAGDTEVEVGFRGRRDEIGQMVEAIQVFRNNALEMRALGEIGQAVSSSLDLQEVLVTIVTHAVRLSKAKEGTIYEYDEATAVFEPRSNFGASPSMIRALHESRIRMGDTTVGRCAAERAPVQLPDVAADLGYRLRDLLLQEGIHSIMAVPLLLEEQVIGALVVRRTEVGAFPENLVKLLQNFAAQSVLAIQNARLYKEIQQKSAQLAAANQMKSQFLANMSHELRTPLNAIIGVTEMLHEDAVDLQRLDDLEPLERVLRAARDLLALINDILDLSKIEAGKFDMHPESFKVAPLVEDVVQTISTIAVKNGNRVVAGCAPNLGTMYADQTRVRQALLNLASNANKFTEHGTVTITARRDLDAGREWVTLAVTDTGIGLTPEQMGKLFQDFVQADASITRKYGGTGLGLAISRRFCQMMGGDIAVTSKAGHGSTFTIRLPVGAEARAQLPEHAK